MPEVPTQPQLTSTQKSINWKNIIIGTVIGAILVGLGVLIFLILQPKPETTSTVTTKKTTPSAKISTPSAQKDEKANWISFTGQKLGIQLKHPENWSAEELFGKPENILVPADTNYILLKQESTGIIIKISEGGSLGGPPNTTNKEIIDLDGIQVTVITYKGFIPLDGGDPYSTDTVGFFAVPINIGDKDVFILATWNETDSDAEKISKEILKTFKFLD